MTRNEFITELREALEGLVPADVLRDNLAYYEEYYRSGHRQGKSDEQISSELGNPRLIAKSIIEANGGEQIYYDSESEPETEEEQIHGRIYTADARKIKIGCAIAAILTLVVLIALFKVIFAFLGPILIIVFVIYLIKEIIGR
jgi:uncharacterized membrane protein